MDSWFLPFNRGWNDGAGNSVNPNGIKTDYLWREVLARAMVVTNGIGRAIQYFHALTNYLGERKSPYRAIVAFSGEHEYGGGKVGGRKVTEATLNGFPSRDIADRFQEDHYRFLVCADKFQTGYDEPLLHTMYVDKPLSDIKAVQTLSRLNRAHPKKHDAFVLDFQNDIDTISDAFANYFRGTVLADETDPDKLHDLQAELDGARVYTEQQVKDLAQHAGSNRSLRGQRGSRNFDCGVPSHCEIRGLDIPDPFWTYCANHPYHRPGRDPIPIGPVYVVDDALESTRKEWRPSPDTEVNLRLREATESRRSLREVMREVSWNAQGRGLTPGLLKSILDDG